MYAKKSLSLDEKDKFLGTQNLPRLNHKEMNNLNKPVHRKEIEFVIKSLQTRKNPGPEGFTGEFDKYFKNYFSNFFKQLKGGKTS